MEGNHPAAAAASASAGPSGAGEPAPARDPKRPKLTALGDYDWDAFGPPVSADAVDARYQRVRAVGEGAYAIVQVARDTVTGDVVAIKKRPAREEAEFEVACFILLRSEPHPNVLGLRGYWTATRPGGETPARTF